MQPPNKSINLTKAESISDLLENCPINETIGNNLVKAFAKINQHESAVCSISGGSDSDVMLDIVWRCDKDGKVTYVWFDTGLEYQATKDHLKYLEEKYGIKISVRRAIKPIPTTCKQYGQPFLSKHVSEMIRRLQKHNFQWEDKPFEELYKEYPKCKSALEWWCNAKPSKAHNISQNKWLKEFLIMYPPKFQISNVCCKYAKKDVSHELLSSGLYDLNIVGVRKAEGGVRATAYKSCFDNNGDGEVLHSKDTTFLSESFETFDVKDLDSNDFVYCDPPYFNSVAAYNENGGWTEGHEEMLLILLDSLNDKGVKFALSNNLKYDNPLLDKWKDKYKVHYLNGDYSNCNYHKIDRSKDIEVLITNY